MKIVCMADTHLQHKFPNPLSVGDMLLHAGDLTFRGDVAEMSQAINWLQKLPYKYKVVICGNHDWLGQRDPALTKNLFNAAGVIYLDHESTTVNGLKIFGSAWTPEFGNWAFNDRRGPLYIGQKWAKIPEDTDILITHGPPKYFGDAVYEMDDMMWPGDRMLKGRRVNAGCADLLNRIKEIKPRYHIGGHIHRGYGRRSIEHTEIINASVVNERYQNVNEPIVFEI